MNPDAIRLVYAPRGETAGHVTFPIQAMCETAGRPMVAALHLLLDAQEKAKLSEAQIAIEKSKTAPYFTAGLNAQYIANGKLFPGYSFGVGIPLVKKGHKQQVSAAEIGALAAQETYASMLLQQHTELGHLLHEIEKYEILSASSISISTS